MELPRANFDPAHRTACRRHCRRQRPPTSTQQTRPAGSLARSAARRWPRWSGRKHHHVVAVHHFGLGRIAAGARDSEDGLRAADAPRRCRRQLARPRAISNARIAHRDHIATRGNHPPPRHPCRGRPRRLLPSPRSLAAAPASTVTDPRDFCQVIHHPACAPAASPPPAACRWPRHAPGAAAHPARAPRR